ncbi:alpha/beta hydrolase [Amycolatopsis endophytica]|uniref:Pimeloyl-ACP methyl ester carboxylesterase n=1 Tax=Amycolatopsis endophytica TaxID=860233 RepID=A0A853BC63_9PSEU|nr:alpha/beta hydrolase [Amycolatopsis endophytica]NYI92342.1 pimeloyl-ACP methyl ester carboxylesterase [Amycolatopsis endophytica]
MTKTEAADRADIFVPHAFGEHTVDLGEIRMNYAVAGDAALPALLLIPGQSESWWGYERALTLLGEKFQAYAVDLRGQGRSTWTPGRYTLDILGNDLVRFIDLVIGRPTLVAGLSSGGVLSAWLSAFAKPGQIRGAVYEDPPLFASETRPACGPSIRQAMGPVLESRHKWLGDQWSIGDWRGMQKALPDELPAALVDSLSAMAASEEEADTDDRPAQNLLEYDPEWARSFVSGTVTAGCDHATMLGGVRVPVLFTHHYRDIDPTTGHLLGAISDLQVARVRSIIEAAGQPFTYRSFPEMPHSMHGADPELYARTVIDWVDSLP